MLIVREADASDSRSIWEWRNDRAARAASLEGGTVPWEGHERWFAASLDNPDRVILIGEEESHRLGMVRFDLDDAGVATVSINIAPEQRGRGRGGELLHAALERLREGRPGVRLLAQVRSTNTASIRLFEREGFVLDGEQEGVLTLSA